MILEIKNCSECPFCNQDNEYGRDSCNLSILIGKNIFMNTFEELPKDKRHIDCPMDGTIDIKLIDKELKKNKE